MRILFFGDVVGRAGREALIQILPSLKKQYESDIVIANGENLAHGKGVTERTLKQVQEGGVDIFTSGNHVWKKEGSILLNNPNIPLLRPANYPPGVVGKGEKTLNILTEKISVVNLIGRVFFRNHYDCPFRKMDEILESVISKDCKIVFVDFHSEATSEVKALGYYLNGRVSAVIGTHTHVQTADEEILSKGTAYLTDAGMCGCKDSILGKETNGVIEGFLKQDAVDSDWGNEWEKSLIEGVFLEITRNGKAKKIERIRKIIKNGVAEK